MPWHTGWIWLLLLPAFAQPPPVFEQGSITFPAVAARDRVAGEDEGFHWVVVTLPQESDLDIGDPLLKQALVKWMADNASMTWLLDPGTTQNIVGAWREALKEFEFQAIGPAELIARPPEEARSAAPAVVRVRFKRKAAAVITALTIKVATESFQRGAAAAQEEELIPPLGAGIRVFARYMSTETSNVEKLKAQLYEAGKIAFAAWEKHMVLPGKVEPAEGELLAAQNEISEPFRFNQTRLRRLEWPVPVAKYTIENAARHEWQVEIRNVRMSAGARLDVPVLIRPATTAGLRRAQDIADRVETAAEARLAAEFTKLRDVVPTGAMLMAVLNEVEKDQQLAAPCDAFSEGRVLVYSCPNRWVRFGFSLTVGVGYSPEEQASGNASFSGDNLFRLSNPDKQRVETESATFSGLYEMQRLTAVWQVESAPLLKLGSTVKYGPRIRGEVFRDRNTLFGNAPADPRLQYVSGTAGPEYYVEYASRRSMKENEKRLPPVWGFSASAGPGFSYGEVTREGVTKVNSGSYWTFSSAVAPSVVFQGAPAGSSGVNELRLMANAQWRRSLADRDYSFTRTGMWLEGSLYFGWARSRDFVLRHRSGVETGGGRIPLFELPRLGGTDQIRGMELGERIGRRAGYSQTSFGPSVENVLTWFGKKRPNMADAPLQLSNVYVVAFVDRGTIDERGSIARLLSRTGVMSYGLAGEIHKFKVGTKSARFSIGYGYSPDSRRHRRGVLITSVAIDLI